MVLEEFIRVGMMYDMQKAVKAVEEGVSIRVAADKYSVPRSSLHNRVSGKVGFQSCPGPSPYLSFEEEEELASFLIQVTKLGYPHTRKQVLSMVERILTSKGLQVSVSSGWFERFCQRHPYLALKTPMPLSHARAAASDPDVLNRYLDTLEETLKKHDIFDKPAHVFNCDETGMPLNPKCGKVIDKKDYKNPCYSSTDTKS